MNNILFFLTPKAMCAYLYDDYTIRQALEKMDQAALDAFLKGSQENAKQVIAIDDKQDELFNTAKKELAQRLAQNPEDADDVLDLLMIAKYLERLSDHSVNVAEWTIFCQTGLYKDQQIV